MDAQGLGRTHPLTPTRRLKQHTHAYNPKVSEIINSIARLIRAVAVLVDALRGWFF